MDADGDDNRGEVGMTVVCVSGYFNPLHVGHLRHFEEAAKYGDLTVILNSDAASTRKSGFSFMRWDERAELIRALRCVKDVVPVDDADGTVVKALITIRPDVYCKGGDRGPDNTPEIETCGHLGIEVKFGVGGDDKLQASSRLIDQAIQSKLISHGIVR